MRWSLVAAWLWAGVTVSPAQEYLWPTNASQFLTSSFGEARPRRFHAAIDIKTWNQTGFKVFATRSGYLERMSISPYGYGRVLYLRLDNGEVAVYAHLERFNDTLQALAEQEQERRGTFRIDKYFEPGTLPVAKGEVIGYTGQSGIGAPHLHFELRDSRNRPINPLQKGFPVVDRIPPTVNAIVVSPLAAGATVDGDFLPQSYQPVRQENKLLLPAPIRVSGTVGIAVNAFDRTNGVTNQLEVYRYQLFINGSLQFQSQFDRFGYADNKYIELVQDYSLHRRGWGRLHRLYRDSANSIDIYSHLNSAGGALVIASDAAFDFDPAGHAESEVDAGRGLAWGRHDFLIVAEDYYGNVTRVEGQLLAGPAFHIAAALEEWPGQRWRLSAASEDGRRDLAELFVAGVSERWHADKPHRWRLLPTEPDRDGVLPPPLPAATLAGTATGEQQGASLASVLVRKNEVRWLRIQARDRWGLLSHPVFVAADTLPLEQQPFAVVVYKDFQPHHLRLEISANLPFAAPPRATLLAGGRMLTAQLVPQEPNRYVAAVPLAAIGADSVWLTVSAQSTGGSSAEVREAFANVPIIPQHGGELASADGRMRVQFSPRSTYWPIYGRVAMETTRVADTRVPGPVYRAEPRDAPLSDAALIEINLPDTAGDPGKLGICFRADNRWIFMASRYHAERHSLTTQAYSLEDFSLMRDVSPPELTVLSPAPGDTTADRRPYLAFRVKDDTSGFESERAITLHLDGKFLISEYDPERDLVSHRPRANLSPGRHVLTARAQDRCGNASEREVVFYVR